MCFGACLAGALGLSPERESGEETTGSLFMGRRDVSMRMNGAHVRAAVCNYDALL